MTGCGERPQAALDMVVVGVCLRVGICLAVGIALRGGLATTNATVTAIAKSRIASKPTQKSPLPVAVV